MINVNINDYVANACVHEIIHRFHEFVSKVHLIDEHGTQAILHVMDNSNSILHRKFIDT